MDTNVVFVMPTSFVSHSSTNLSVIAAVQYEPGPVRDLQRRPWVSVLSIIIIWCLQTMPRYAWIYCLAAEYSFLLVLHLCSVIVGCTFNLDMLIRNIKLLSRNSCHVVPFPGYILNLWVWAGGGGREHSTHGGRRHFIRHLPNLPGVMVREQVQVLLLIYI